MSPETPLACTLSAAELPGRLAEIAALGRNALIGVRPDGSLRFRNDPAVRSRLDAIVAAESECCAFLDLELRESGRELVLAIHAPEGGDLVARELAGAFRGLAG